MRTSYRLENLRIILGLDWRPVNSATPMPMPSVQSLRKPSQRGVETISTAYYSTLCVGPVGMPKDWRVNGGENRCPG